MCDSARSFFYVWKIENPLLTGPINCYWPLEFSRARSDRNSYTMACAPYVNRIRRAL